MGQAMVDRCRRPAAPQRRAIGLLLATVLAGAAPAGAAEPGGPAGPSGGGTGDPALVRKVDALLAETGLDAAGVSLVIYSTASQEAVYRRNPDTPRIPASNVKLVTSYAALRELSPNFRWETRFYRVRENDGPDSPNRQGLLVVGSGDPTLRYADLEELGLELRLKGLRRVDGHLFYDDSLFDEQPYPEAWGTVVGDQPWYAPVSPFIVNYNVAGFQVAVLARGRRVEVMPETPSLALHTTSEFTRVPAGRELIRVRQTQTDEALAFHLTGEVPPQRRTYSVTTAIADPVEHFVTLLRTSLRRAGVEGEMPIRDIRGTGHTRERIHTHRSPPLRTLLPDMNKDSNNLVAEVVLRALAARHQDEGISEADGVRVLRRVIGQEFPRFRGDIRLVDGSGLSRDNRLTSRFLVALLRRVLTRFDFRAEYLHSLSLGGWDGTLRYRDYPARQWGRIRAKSGTLRGVQNLSGYFSFGREVLVFSFLVEAPGRDYTGLQQAQDRVLSGVFDHFIRRARPPASVKREPEGLQPPPVSAKPSPAISTASSE